MAEFTREEILAKVAAGESLEGADLSGANLILVHLNGANLSGANLQGATYTAFSKWPEGYDPVAKGALEVDV